ncbi:hypothetical protein [Solemya velum gill symbiont]|uniref:hypothetical protein n=1 Tax=Solemya velum gill symbiont TaxID=2340 RepID=UPI000997F7E3|nr:hypothetical protein [Solemya velum gill symbiont]OOZ44352.1 hypothetical protein BOW37_07015 [Solemya velum gill symbiont]OOZ46601.1 hypothetical protein BOW38_07010 [Solemya velum gill symbiont]OOZ48922.1 hypothetical protein BOW39_08420 [Solemya velum gill symbiont]OOZ51409.1 hypothetical protein BOW40_07790 [Solemya velum gill symbiont]OOZ53984.1 hypothetical protein BOW41_07800 [Solemya velum gill symbiont]
MRNIQILLLATLLLGCTTTGATGLLTLNTCINFGCSDKKKVYMPQNEIESLKSLFAGTVNAETEREKIAQAIGWFEYRVGNQNGTWRDKGRNPGRVDPEGQLDCIAESLNTTTYLKQIERLGLLKWHSVDDRVVRHRMIFGTHWTAVIKEKENSDLYAVDSWYEDNGTSERVIPLETWFNGAERIL